MHCHLQSCSWGCCDGPGPLQLLHQLPALQLLQLSGCSWLQGVPRPVLECQGLTQLVLSNNGMLMQLPGDITRLTALQVGSLEQGTALGLQLACILLFSDSRVWMTTEGLLACLIAGWVNPLHVDTAR